MNLAELTDLELADKAISDLERVGPHPHGDRGLGRDERGYPCVTAEGRLRLEALFRELRRARRLAPGPYATTRWMTR